jgi:hypothetical protein
MAQELTQPLTEVNIRNLVKRCRRVMLTNSPPYVSRFSMKCGILNVSRIYRPPQPVIEIPLLYSTPVI